MERSWVIKGFGREDLSRVAALAEEYYGSENDIADAAYLDHEYFANPAGDVIMSLAVDEEAKRLAGQYGVIPIKVKIGERNEPCVMSVNTVTSADYYGQGVFKTLAADVYDRVSASGRIIAYGMPNEKSYPGFLKYLGFSDIGAIPLWMRPLDLKVASREFFRGGPLSAILPVFGRFFKLRSRPGSGVRVLELTDKDREVADVFWERIKDKYGIMITRDSDYMLHRFVHNPRRKYHCLYAMQDDGPVALVIGRVMEVSGLTCGMVADLLFVEGHAAEAEVILRELLLKMKSEGAGLAGCLMLPGTEECGLLKKNLFLRCPKAMEPQPFRLITREFGNTKDIPQGYVQKLDNWFFTMGDYDVV